MAVYKKDNCWYVDYYMPNGKRRREVVTIKGVDPKHINRQDALKALSIRKAEMAQGKFDIANKHSKWGRCLTWYLGNNFRNKRGVHPLIFLISYNTFYYW
jgi:hypothetical protein